VSPTAATVTRPRSIRAVQYLLLATAVAAGLVALTTPLTLAHLGADYQRLLRHGVPEDWDVLGMDGDLRLGVLQAAVAGTLCLVAAAIPIRGIGRGRRWARVSGWVAAAVVAVVETIQMSTDFDMLPDVVPEQTHTGDHVNDTATALLNNLLPGWYLPMYYTAEIFSFVAMFAVAWLLRVPSAGGFFEDNTPSSPADAAKVWDISVVRRNTVERR
jgi:hypothetical protein